MNKVTIIAGILLGLMFILFGLNHFFEFAFLKVPMDFAGQTQAEQFWNALYDNHYLAFVKALEVLGGLLVAIPKTRNFGIVILAPIIANILAFKVFLQKGGAVFDIPFTIILVLFAVVLVGGSKRLFTALLS